MEPIKYVLTSPIKKGDIDVTTLVFSRRVKAKDFQGMSAELDQDANMLLISRLTGIELYLIEELDGYDYIRAAEILGYFLGSGPTIGKGLSGN
jgi:hypothetical protein